MNLLLVGASKDIKYTTPNQKSWDSMKNKDSLIQFFEHLTLEFE